MAAYAASARIDSLATMPAMNLSQALMTFTGQNIGAGDADGFVVRVLELDFQGDDPLDGSAVHPEAYPVVRRISAK